MSLSLAVWGVLGFQDLWVHSPVGLLDQFLDNQSKAENDTKNKRHTHTHSYMDKYTRTHTHTHTHAHAHTRMHTHTHTHTQCTAEHNYLNLSG